MMKEAEWLCQQRSSAQKAFQKATHELMERAPKAALRFVGDRPGVSMAIALGAGFATGFAAVRRITSDKSEPPPSNGAHRASRDATSWIQSATSNLRAFVSAAALVKALGHELRAAAPEPPPAHQG